MDQRAYHTLPPLMQKLLAHDAALRAEVGKAWKNCERISGEFEAKARREKARADKAEADNAALRKLVEEAPHEKDCHSRYKHTSGSCAQGYDYPTALHGRCDCWKHAALEASHD